MSMHAQQQVAQQPIQYLYSPNFDQDIPDDDVAGKVSTYFNPSVTFPEYIEFVSVTLMYNNKKPGSTEKIIYLATGENGGSDKPVKRTDFKLTHKVDELITTVKCPPTLVLDKKQPFYFFSDKEQLKDSCLTLGYRNYNGNFGDREKTPLKKI